MAAFIVDHHLQKPNLKHFCKICKKGFGCGRALGGHMRAHGIADDSTTPPSFDDDDPATTDWDDNNHTNLNNKSNLGPTNRRMYALRTNPNRLKTCRVCHNCGKEFFSWKSFLEHGKCTTTSDDLDSLLSSPPCSDDDDDDADDDDDDDDGDECTAAARRGSGNHSNNNWLKRKRSLRVKVGSPASNEDEDLANCLIMLSNGAVEPMFEEDEAEAEAEAEESCASASKEDHHLLHQDHHLRNNHNNSNIRKPINFIPPLSYRLPDQDKPKAAAPKGMFECKACKKVFNSHQALGGHRASHKKVKGCFAARLDHMDLDPRENDDVFEDSFFPTKSSNNSYENGLGNSTMASTSKRKTKVHECSICHRIFSSGQALGGHKRCHWITSNAAAEAPPPPSITKIHQFHDQRVGPPPFDSTSTVVLPLDLKLDLNLPALADEVRRPAFEVSTEIYLQSWICKNNKVNENDECEKQQRQQHPNHKDNENKVIIKNEEENNCTKNNNMNTNNNVEDEADSKVKLAKLSELNDTSMSGGNSSPWLQVGIGSTTDVRADP